MFFRKKINEDFFTYHFNKNRKEVKKEIRNTNLGLGNITVYQEDWRKVGELKRSQLKELINLHFKPLIKKEGFEGKDYKFFKEVDRFFFLINFFPSRYVGGGLQVDLLVKIKGIEYPPRFTKFKHSKSTKYCEFSKRLSPINTSVWFWLIKEKPEETKSIFEDIYKVFLNRGLEFFKQFDSLDSIVSDINVKAFKKMGGPRQDPKIGFPSYHREFYEGLMSSIYFIHIFEHNRKKYKKAKDLAQFGISSFHEPYRQHQNPFLEEFQKYLT